MEEEQFDEEDEIHWMEDKGSATFFTLFDHSQLQIYILQLLVYLDVLI